MRAVESPPAHGGNGAAQPNGHGHDAAAQPPRVPSRNGHAAAAGAPLERTSTGVVSPATTSRQHRLKTLTSGVFVLAAMGCIAVTLPGPWLLIGTAVMALTISWQGWVDRRRTTTVLLAVSVGFTAVDYLAWRTAVSNWAGWFIAAPLLAAEIFGALHTLGLQYTVWPWPRPRLVRREDPTRRPIFVLIPTVNEGPRVLTLTIQGALEARRQYLNRFPRARVSVVVCNDARVAGLEDWREVEVLARRLGAMCVTRTAGGGNKAGNLEHARQSLAATGDALVAIFDADQVARPDFLLQTVPHFGDPSIGWVQTGQYYRNLHQPVARWANDQQALFYRVLCPGKSANNAAFICGTNVVIRATALDQIGGLPQDSLTEDFAASIQLHPRWRSIFLPDLLAVGLGPMDLPAFLKQQRRWAIGTMGVLRKHWPAILLPRRGGLRMQQRVQYALACTHYVCGLRDLIYVVSPIAFLVTGIPAVRAASLGLFLWHFLPYWVASQAAFWYAARRQTGLRGIVMGFGSFPVLIQALLTVLLGLRGAFTVTSKRRRGQRSWGHLTVYGVALFACLVAIVIAMLNRGLRPESVTISVFWVIYDIALLSSFLWLGVMDLRFNEGAASWQTQVNRIAARSAALTQRKAWLPSLPAIVLRPDEPLRVPVSRLAPSPRTIRPAAAVAAVLLLTIGLVPHLPPFATAPPVHVSLSGSRQPGASPYLGLSMPQQMLETRPAALQRRLCLPLAVIGRTQDIDDSFDFVWASQLGEQNRRPWISLEFGKLDANRKPPLEASLPAIMNGVQDANIERWARAVHAYGKPVYLTILLHTDRDWAVSSAVANGGIPQDAPRAWEHVQSIFRAMGDTNVVWVWSPADPARDQDYAPPDSNIGVVLQSMIRYPDTPWPDPTAVLQAVGRRHPTRPLLVEVSAAGAPAEKAVWLERVATAVAADPQVYALIYHEGAPDVHATAAQHAQWSVESDPSSLQAMLTWQSLLPTGTLPCQSSRFTGQEAAQLR